MNAVFSVATKRYLIDHAFVVMWYHIYIEVGLYRYFVQYPKNVLSVLETVLVMLLFILFRSFC